MSEQRNPWLAMSVVIGATIMVALDTTIVNVALHSIGEDLDAGAGIEWVVTSYLLAVCFAQPATGWLADRFGRRPIFLTSITWFTLASLACGLAPNLPLLVAARLAQGLGGGALIPVGMAIALDLFPPNRRGKAMATWGMSSMAAPAIGPTVGGWLVSTVSWHWLFFINLPVGIITLAAGLRLLPARQTVEHRRFDVPGLLLGGFGLAAGVLGLSQGSQWGWTAFRTLICLVGGVVLLIGYVVSSLHREQPLIELRMFSARAFRLSIGVVMLLGVAQYGRLVFIPLQLQELRGYSPVEVGLLFLPAAVGSAAGMQLGGRLVDRIGARRPVVIGCIGVAISTLGFWRLQLTTPVWVIVVLMCAQGLAWGMTTAPSLVAGISDVPKRLLAQASAVRSLAQQVSGAVSVAALAAIVNSRLDDSAPDRQRWVAYTTVFLVGGVAALIGMLLALGLPDRPETIDDEDAAEAAHDGAMLALLE